VEARIRLLLRQQEFLVLFGKVEGDAAEQQYLAALESVARVGGTRDGVSTPSAGKFVISDLAERGHATSLQE